MADMNLITVLTSGGVAGLVGGFVALRISKRNILIENITKERKLWREKVRTKASEVVKYYQEKNHLRLMRLYVEFQIILNPNDKDDISILGTLWNMKKAKEDEDKEEDSNLIIEFSEKLSLLLKHDWERSKLEAKPVWRFREKAKSARCFREKAKSVRCFREKAERISYCCFKNKRIKKEANN